MKGVRERENGETGAESETYKERVWFNLLSKPWNGIGVIRESKKYICASLPSTPLVFDAPKAQSTLKQHPALPLCTAAPAEQPLFLPLIFYETSE